MRPGGGGVGVRGEGGMLHSAQDDGGGGGGKEGGKEKGKGVKSILSSWSC